MAELRALGKDLFVVDGPVVRDMGITYNTRMTAVRLSDGSVWIASPVPVSFTTIAEITALGPVRHLVSPTPRHYWRLHAWHALFPEARLWSSPVTAVTLRNGPLLETETLGEPAPAAWAGDLDQAIVRGSALVSEVVFFHAASRTLLVEDLIQVHERRPGHPVRNALITVGGVAAPRGGVARDIRLSFRDRAAARQSLIKILEWDFDQLVVAHGPVITHAGRRRVEDAFSWLGLGD